LGGHNWKIPIPLPECPVPIMLIGISLSHAEKDSSDPSIAGFVGTTLQGGVGYKNFIDVQHPGLNIVAKEVIRRAMESLLSKYRDINNGALPEKLIIYRNGGSEGSYQAILKNEFMGK
jgi:eukaryotic translation initiation factor 2C